MKPIEQVKLHFYKHSGGGLLKTRARRIISCAALAALAAVAFAPDARAQPAKMDPPSFAAGNPLIIYFTRLAPGSVNAGGPYNIRVRAKSPLGKWTQTSTGGKTIADDAADVCAANGQGADCRFFEFTGAVYGGVIYQAQVRGVHSENGIGAWSDIADRDAVGDLADAPDAPESVTAATVSLGLNVEWPAVSGNVTNYRVRWRFGEAAAILKAAAGIPGAAENAWQGWVSSAETGDIILGDSDDGISTGGTDTSYSIENLEGEIGYEVAVAAEYRGSLGDWIAATGTTGPRPLRTDTTLSAVEISRAPTPLDINSGTATSNSVITYNVEINPASTSVTVNPVPGDNDATAAVNGNEPPVEVPTPLGDTLITIVVTAEDGMTTKTYDITATRRELPPIGAITLAADAQAATESGAGLRWSSDMVQYEISYQIRRRLKYPRDQHWHPMSGGDPITAAAETDKAACDAFFSKTCDADDLANLHTGVAADLFAAATYEFQVAAVNQHGRGPWSNIAESAAAGTAAAAPSPPENVRLREIYGGLAISWSPPSASADIRDYRVRWRESGGAWRGWADAADAADLPVIGDSDFGAGAGIVTEYAIVGLKSDTEYEVGVASVNEATLSGWISRSATTLSQLADDDANLFMLEISDAEIEFAPDTTEYSATVQNSVSSVTLTPVTSYPGAGVTIRISDADVLPTTVPSGEASAPFDLTVGEPLTLTIVVTATDAVTTRTYSVTVTRSQTLPPASAPSIVIDQGNAAGSFMHWNAVSGATSYLGRWRIKSPGLTRWQPGADGGEIPAPIDSRCSQRGFSANCRQYAFPAEFDNVTYQLQIAAANSVGVGAWSSVVNIITQGSGVPGPATPPENVRLRPTADGFEIDWRAPQATITDYRVRWRRAETTAWQGWVDAPNLNDAPLIGDSDDGISTESASPGYTLTGLAAGATYEVGVTAVNQTAFFAWSGDPNPPDGSGLPALPVESATVLTPDQLGQDTTLVSLQVVSETGGDPDIPAIAGITDFTPGKSLYEVDAGFLVTRVSVTAAANDPNATLAVRNGPSPATALLSGEKSGEQPLGLGDTTITVTVTAQNGAATRDYNIRITRSTVTPPEKVGMLANVAGAGINPFWDAAVRANSYLIRYRTRNPNGAWQPSDAGTDAAATAAAEADCMTHNLAAGCLAGGEVTDLFAIADYVFQIAGVGEGGRGVWSDGLDVSTTGRFGANPPADAPTELMLQRAAGGLNAEWTAPTVRHTGYRIRWRLIGGNWQGWASDSGGNLTIGDSDDGISTPIDAVAGDAPEYTLSMLAGATTYEVAVAAVDDDKIGPWSEAAIAETLSLDKDTSLRNLAVSPGALASAFDGATLAHEAAISNTHITLKPEATLPAAEVFVTCMITDAMGTAAEQKVEVAFGASITCTLAGGENTIGIDVFPENAADGEIVTNYTVTVTNTTGVPEAPRNVAVAGVDAGINVNWDAPESNGGFAIATYNVQWKLSTDAEYPAENSAEIAAADTEHAIAGLTNAVQYDVHVAAVNFAGAGAFSAAAQIAAGEPVTPVAPGAPQNLTLSADTAVITAEWEVPADTGNSAINGYRLRWRPESATTFALSDTRDSDADVLRATIDELTNAVSYVVEVAAINFAGPGEFVSATSAKVGSADSSLSALNISDGFIDAEFAPAQLNYRVTLAAATGGVTVAPVLSHTAATMTVQGAPAQSGESVQQPTVFGDTAFTIVVTAENTETISTYVVTFFRPQVSPTDATLASLAVSGGILEPEFAPDQFTYGITVAPAVTAVTITPGVNTPGATMLINTVEAMHEEPFSQTLTGEETAVAIEVTAEDGMTTGTYGITIFRPRILSTDASLSSLLVSDSMLEPPFDPAELNYRVTVAFATTAVTVTPSAHPDAEIKVKDVLVQNSAEISQALDEVGEHEIVIVVTAEDMVNAMTYTITFIRLGNLIFDINGDGQSTADEGIVIARYLFGIRGAPLIEGYEGVFQKTPAEIASALNVNRAKMDIDASGEVNAADAMLIARFLLGVESGTGLTDGIIAESKESAVTEKLRELISGQEAAQ